MNYKIGDKVRWKINPQSDYDSYIRGVVQKIYPNGKPPYSGPQHGFMVVHRHIEDMEYVDEDYVKEHGEWVLGISVKLDNPTLSLDDYESNHVLTNG